MIGRAVTFSDGVLGGLLIMLAAGSVACGAANSAAVDSRVDGVTSDGVAGEAVAGDPTLACPRSSVAASYVAPCPSSCPAAASACGPELTRCEYGDDPRGEPCRTLALCESGTWTAIAPITTVCEALGAAPACPVSAAMAQGQACNAEHSYCTFAAEATACLCTTCFWNGGVLLTPCPTGSPSWHCLARPAGIDPGCPTLKPRFGTSCSGEVSCHYQCGAGGIRKCQGGMWIGLDGGFCPV